jgi:hypothetical protein
VEWIWYVFVRTSVAGQAVDRSGAAQDLLEFCTSSFPSAGAAKENGENKAHDEYCDMEMIH